MLTTRRFVCFVNATAPTPTLLCSALFTYRRFQPANALNTHVQRTTHSKSQLNDDAIGFVNECGFGA